MRQFVEGIGAISNLLEGIAAILKFFCNILEVSKLVNSKQMVFFYS